VTISEWGFGDSGGNSLLDHRAHPAPLPEMARGGSAHPGIVITAQRDPAALVDPPTRRLILEMALTYILCPAWPSRNIGESIREGAKSSRKAKV
jgi:hypothetical protein